MFGYEIRKLLRSPIALAVALLLLAGCMAVNGTVYRNRVPAEYNALATALEGPLSMENYAALAAKEARAKGLFGQAVFANTPFDASLVMKRDGGGYAAGEKVAAERSPVWGFDTDTEEQRNAVSALFMNYDALMRQTEKWDEKAETARQTLEWFEGGVNYETRRAERVIQAAEDMQAPQRFFNPQEGGKLLESFLYGVWALLFVLILSALLAGAEQQAGVLPLTQATCRRSRILWTKLLCVPVLAAVGICVELICALAFHPAAWPALLSGRLQNYLAETGDSYSLMKTLLVGAGVKFAVLTGIGWMVCFFTRICGSAAGGLAAGGILVFLPVVLQLAGNMTGWPWMEAVYLHSPFALASGRELWVRTAYENFWGFPLTVREAGLLIWLPVSLLAAVGYRKLSGLSGRLAVA
ncbi:MAG TPA: hypothetical protein H9668_00715 [Firmicutes bacterium]|nr:hypothetical protein [Bacillota bacterium]